MSLIREYKPEDIERIEKCIFELNQEEYDRRPEYWENPKSTIGVYVSYLLKEIDKNQGKIFVAEEKNRIVGCIIVVINKEESPDVKIKKNSYVTDVVVLKDYQNQGIGGNRLDKKLSPNG